MNISVWPPDQAEADLVAMFLALSQVGKADALAALTHWETIRTREAYLLPNAPIDGNILRQSNEYIHRLAGYTVEVLRGETPPERDASFISMIIETSSKRGCGELDRLRARLHKASDAHGTVPLTPNPGP